MTKESAAIQTARNEVQLLKDKAAGLHSQAASKFGIPPMAIQELVDCAEGVSRALDDLEPVFASETLTGAYQDYRAPDVSYGAIENHDGTVTLTGGLDGDKQITAEDWANNYEVVPDTEKVIVTAAELKAKRVRAKKLKDAKDAKAAETPASPAPTPEPFEAAPEPFEAAPEPFSTTGV